ncbi:MAG: NAD-dependent epimerase/dehydratase family protein [Bacteroidetes bacterium]|nr:NAD-dependent epimerase/dehydratase family protein [Bacteroidota bacterium]
MKKKVFVTGISGLLGTNTVIELLEQGYKVKGLVRDASRYHGPVHKDLELLEGKLSDDLTPMMTGVDVVVHIAAETSQDLTRYYYYWNNNYFATIQLYQSAIQAGVRRFIFVSTANTIGNGVMHNPGTERNPMRYPFSASWYAQSKATAENYLLEHESTTGVIILNPCFMLGAHDSKPSSGRLILSGLNKRVVLYPSGGKNFVHVRDVASGIMKCIEAGRNGEKYLLGNENLSYYDFFKKLNLISGQDPLMIRIPRGLMVGLGVIGDLMRALRIRTGLSSVNMKILSSENYYSNQKSRTELGLEYRPVEQAIIDAVSYFRETGMN